jgi:hypothetical protein
MAIPKPSNEVRNYLAAIGAKGGKAFTPKKSPVEQDPIEGW